MAQLALKHRGNKNQRQRIILFCATPIEESSKDLVTLGKRLKKNNVAVDVVLFGEVDAEQVEKGNALVDAVNAEENSHVVVVPPGPRMLSESLGPVIHEAVGGAEQDAFGAFGGAGGFDEELDPETLLAIELSRQEYEREQAAMRAATSSGDADMQPSTQTTNQVSPNAPQLPAAPSDQVDVLAMDEDEELRRAIEMSLLDMQRDASEEDKHQKRPDHDKSG